jgi:hypothetical protein
MCGCCGKEGEMMRIYECAECGDVKLAKDWAYCSNPCDDVAMAEVMDWGKTEILEKVGVLVMAYKNERSKQAIIPQ